MKNLATKSIITSNMLAEVELTYKTKLKKSELAKVSSSQDAYNYLSEVWQKLKTIDYVESAVVLFLNKNNKILGWRLLSTGGTGACLMDIKTIFQGAILANATGIIMSHNHPSGNKRPSAPDKDITQRIKKAGVILDIELLDHIIITDEGYFSFADEGIL